MSGDIQERRMAEGQTHIQAAEKYMKTSFFKWKPDLDSAASEYTKAATCFRNAKAFKEAKGAFLKAADVHKQMNAIFHAAKMIEQAGLLCKEFKDVEGCVNLLEHAADLFHQNGTADTAALTLDRAAKSIELNYPGKAAELYDKACSVSELDDKSRQCAEFAGKAGRLFVRAEKYDLAIEALKREIEFHHQTDNFPMINRVILGVVMVYLQNGDPVAAENFFTTASNRGTGEDEFIQGADELIRAFNDGDEDAAREILSKPFVKFMDNCFAKIARGLVIPAGGGGRVGVVKNASANEIQDQGAQLADDDLEDGGLC
ncbi:gamma-soluble NSF attachment protein-like [Ostrea edulis]|uniref:gamma-soluble NSF attachment protein-like n=1 Tax=Ostrea edulis TaxID=37623 RepID=UPI0024AE9A86|nr:gamma-soluble NSF attachment protein-like [Ostrea edulis]